MVYCWDRVDKKPAFIDTAEQLTDRLIELMANGSKKYRFFGQQRLVEDAQGMEDMLCQANRLNPGKPAQADARELLLRRARGRLEHMECEFGRQHRRMHFPEGVLKDVDELMRKEEKLLDGIIESDKRRR